jgi:hypothetical protein
VVVRVAAGAQAANLRSMHYLEEQTTTTAYSIFDYYE